jgi:heat shock protein HtpX
MDEATTAQSLADAGRPGFRLTAETPLLTAPQAGAPVAELLPAGALVIVRDDAGAFLQVITSQDRFGFIPDETPVQAMEWSPEVEKSPAAERAVTARQALAAGPAMAYPAAGAVPAAAIVAPLYRDDDFTPAPPVTPEERVLIYDRIASNKRRTLFLIVGFAAFAAMFFTAVGVVAVAYGGSDPAEEPLLIGQMAAFFGILALGMGIFMYATSTRAVLAVSGARQVSKAEEPQLYRIVENLAIGSGLPMPKVYVMDDSAPNAFATGHSPDGAVVCATTGLLQKLEKRELEAVMAHEMSHVGNYDIRLMTAVAVLVGIIALGADLMLRFTYYGAGARSSNKGKGGGTLGAILLVLAFALIVLSPIIASAMRFAMSRRREYLADASGALLCRNPDALADALEKISRDPEPLEAANKATAHLYISNPLKEHASFMNNLFATHPPVEERIAVLRAMG